MEANAYQRLAVNTAIYPDDQAVVYPILGLCGEAGEVAEKIKKVLRSGRTFPFGATGDERVELLKELGDVQWYIANLANDLGFTLEDVMSRNLAKLGDRAQRGVIEGSGDNR